MKRLARLLGKLLLFALSLLAGLGLLEGAVRLLLDVPKPLGVRHPVLGRTYRPGYETVIRSREGEGMIPLRFNRDGFRGPDVALERSSGTGRVAVIGDSFVAGISVEEDSTFVAQLQRLLARARPGTGWEVMNFGVGAASTGQELVLYRELVSRYRPDVVVLAYFMGNDLTDNSMALSDYPRLYFGLDGDGGLVEHPFAAQMNWSRWLNESSRLYVWQKTVRKRIEQRLNGSGEPAFNGHPLDFVADPDGELEAAWRLTERLIVEFRDQVDRNGSRLLLVLLPPGEQIYDDRWQALLASAGPLAPRMERDYPSRRLEVLAAREDIAVLSLGEALRRAAAGRPAEETADDALLYFHGDGHFTPRGHRVAAEAMLPFVLEGVGGGAALPER